VAHRGKGVRASASGSLFDIRLPSAAQARSDPRAHFRAARSEWLEFEFHTDQDVSDLLALAGEAVVAARAGN
jgi:hypothetical protein